MKLREKTIESIFKSNNLKRPVTSNIIDEKSSRARTRAILETITRTISGSLGPYGSTTIIQGHHSDYESSRHLTTKDGHDIINSMVFGDEMSRLILEMVRQIAKNQVLTVGDGSTSSIIVANALYQIITDEKSKEVFSKITPKDIVDILNHIGDYVEGELPKLARPVGEDFHEIELLAKIANNNDAEIGKFIRDIYQKIGPNGFITTEIPTKRQDKDEVVIKPGMTFDSGFISPIYGIYDSYAEDGKLSYRLGEGDGRIKLFMTDETLTVREMDMISDIISEVISKGNRLVIIAKDYDEDMKYFLNHNKQQYLDPTKEHAELHYVPLYIPLPSKLSKFRYQDLETLTGAKSFNPFDRDSAVSYILGEIDTLIATDKTFDIIPLEKLEDEAEENKQKVIAELNRLIKELSDHKEAMEPEDLYIARKRLSSYTNSNATIKISGKTLSEKKTRERLLEDAILASKSAINVGVISGGNLMVPRLLILHKADIIEQLEDKFYYIKDKIEFDVFITIVTEAFLESYRTVLNNSYFSIEETEAVVKKCLEDDTIYNLKTHKYEDILTTEVINSVDTDIQILRSTFSIIGSLGVANQVLVRNIDLDNLFEG